MCHLTRQPEYRSVFLSFADRYWLCRHGTTHDPGIIISLQDGKWHKLLFYSYFSFCHFLRPVTGWCLDVAGKWERNVQRLLFFLFLEVPLDVSSWLSIGHTWRRNGQAEDEKISGPILFVLPFHLLLVLRLTDCHELVFPLFLIARDSQPWAGRNRQKKTTSHTHIFLLFLSVNA